MIIFVKNSCAGCVRMTSPPILVHMYAQLQYALPLV